jgi:hypothetical protein
LALLRRHRSYLPLPNMSTNAITTVSGAASLAAVMCPPPPVILNLDAQSFFQWNVHLHAILGRHGLLNHINGSLAVAPTDQSRSKMTLL